MQSAERIHSLDSLRAFLMLLGIVLHAGVCYMAAPIPPYIWPFQDQQKSIAFDLLVFFMHSFRMPLFFLLAGFFARMIYSRRGASGFLRHRFLRIGVPFLIFLPLSYAFARYVFVHTHPELVPPFFVTVHLWFLYYLLFYSLVAAAAGHRPAWDAAFARFWASPWRWPALIALTALLLHPQAMAGFDPDMKLLPNPWIVLAYGLLYTTGWLLFPAREFLQDWQRNAWKLSAAALLLMAAYLPLAVQLSEAYAKQPTPHIVESLVPPEPLHAIATLIAAAMTWLSIAAVTGLFLRYAQQPSPLVRYLADAAYWVYLLHLFPVLYLPLQLSSWKAGAATKFALTVVATATFCLLSYEVLIRRRPWAWLFSAASPSAYESASRSH
jgi:glucans biosynthesis protein C